MTDDYIGFRKRVIGVYGIVHSPSGRTYIGSSIDVINRYSFHKHALRHGIHKTSELQRMWNQDGEDCFEFKVLEFCGRDVLLDREQHWLDLQAEPLNTLRNARGLGRPAGSAVTSEAAKARWSDPEYRAKRSEFLSRRTSTGQFVRNPT